MIQDKNPLEFVSKLIALSVKPFEAASKWHLTYFKDEYRQLTLLLLYPAMLLALPLSLLICALVMAYVFLVLPFLMIYQGIEAFFSPPPRSRRGVGRAEPSGRE